MRTDRSKKNQQLTFEALGSDPVLTHDELSRFVGARRETVTDCLNRLAKNETLEDEKTATFITKIIESIASRMASDTTSDRGTRPKIDHRANPSST